MVEVQREHRLKADNLFTFVAECVYEGHKCSIGTLGDQYLLHWVDLTIKLASIDFCDLCYKFSYSKGAIVLVMACIHRSIHIFDQKLGRHQIWCAFS